MVVTQIGFAVVVVAVDGAVVVVGGACVVVAAAAAVAYVGVAVVDTDYEEGLVYTLYLRLSYVGQACKVVVVHCLTVSVG
ncbi:unnamed protein product [[Candida] boidinii]|nr:unnamed protein product [[Candida] boidinii]